MEMEIVKAEERQGLNEGPALFVVMGFVSRNSIKVWTGPKKKRVS